MHCHQLFQKRFSSSVDGILRFYPAFSGSCRSRYNVTYDHSVVPLNHFSWTLVTSSVGINLFDRHSRLSRMYVCQTLHKKFHHFWSTASPPLNSISFDSTEIIARKYLSYFCSQDGHF